MTKNPEPFYSPAYELVELNYFQVETLPLKDILALREQIDRAIITPYTIDGMPSSGVRTRSPRYEYNKLKPTI
jgi:hypothetical protein